MGIHEIPVKTLDGQESSLASLAGKALLVVNVASKCGLTPQYSGLERLQERFGGQGFTVVGFPCNQFAGQEPGTAEEIATFCSATYGVSFPLVAKADVNGPHAHPVYQQLTAAPDAAGEAGQVQWNFEKFVLDGDGNVLAGFRPRTEPTAPEVREAIESLLA